MRSRVFLIVGGLRMQGCLLTRCVVADQRGLKVSSGVQKGILTPQGVGAGAAGGPAPREFARASSEISTNIASRLRAVRRGSILASQCKGSSSADIENREFL